MTRLALALVLAVLATTGANASICGTRPDIIGQLAARYDEAPLGAGLIHNSGLVEVWVSEAGTFSVIVTSTQGRTCIIAAGHSWQERKAPAGEAL